jgi:CRP-like cAMP-binding protein
MPLDGLLEVAPLVRKLESIQKLTNAEETALAELPMQVRDIPPDQDIVRQGEQARRCCVILEGFAFRYKLAGEDGRRQIMAFHIAGDMPDLMSLQFPVMDHSIGTLGATKVAFIDHQPLRDIMRNHPRIGHALWRASLIEDAIGREWLVQVGRRNAYHRLAHLVCELFVRLDAAGLIDGRCINVPLTQNIVGDALGLSTVHVNRVLQALRADGLVAWKRNALIVTDWQALQDAAEFDPAYLHLPVRGEDTIAMKEPPFKPDRSTFAMRV